ncbi:UNVERIFIED_CONTAM: Monooxygenase 2 [Sesamum latifolium]|uniref:Monooxygenase 2 n=1 Tax=Sesamum latifolium TaxID=2727402 RepID=A0AAW2XJ40_9LAMI
MEKSVEDVVIVGAGIAGLATALGLHRLGIRSLVLESGDSLRTSGFALGIWTNGWRALDALGVGDILRSKHTQLTGGRDDHDLRAVNRKMLLETLETGLPKGTIRFSSKVVRIETDHHHQFNSIHLADGTVLQTKVLIGCDGVNSVVARFLGFSKPSFAGRSGVRAWWILRMAMVLSQSLCNSLERVLDTVLYHVMIAQFTGFSRLVLLPKYLKKLKYKTWPRGCVALEDSIVLARVLAKALKEKASEKEHERIQKGLEKYARERRWRSIDLISTAYMVGFMQQSDGVVLNFVRDKIMAKFMAGMLLKKAGFDCGKLTVLHRFCFEICIFIFFTCTT